MIKKIIITIWVLSLQTIVAAAFAESNDFYELQIYHVKNNRQAEKTDAYLKEAYLPALHKMGIKNIGVFKPVANDTASAKLIYVLIPFASQMQWIQIDDKLHNDKVFTASSKDFTAAPAEDAPYERMECLLMQAFKTQPHLLLPAMKDTGRIYELRSYESPTQHLFEKKRAMFNNDEVKIFNRLGFNPVFYATVIAGSHMPNLMYMPVFTGIQQRDEQWKNFGNDATWKKISADPKNENNVSVSHIDSILMHAASYSDY